MEMHELTTSLKTLNTKLTDLRGILRLDEKETQIAALQAEASNPDFWKDQENAQKKSKKLSFLENEVLQWKKISQTVSDLLEMAQMDEADKDVNLREDIEKQFILIQKEINELEFHALMDGKYDDHGAIVAIHAGAGGTEAQDWASMLTRMVFRYCEKKEWKTNMLDESRGQEAGIKSVVFRVEGPYAYGHLKSEHGTHRLVRISPFNADKLRQTSFANIEVIPELEESDTNFEIDPKDLRIDVFMAGGKGGQSVNTTYSAVRIVHLPTNITVQCQNERSQLQNREVAMRVLKSKLLKLKEEEAAKEKLELRGEYKSAEWGNQIRSYVLHPYHMVKDIRTRHETADTDAVLDGDIDAFVEAYLRWVKS